MKMKRKKLAMFAIAVALIVSFVAVTAHTTDGQRAKITTHVRDVTEHTWEGTASKAVVYDNGMAYVGVAASQYDPTFYFDPIVADDFILDEDQRVNDVHWIGVYWNGGDDGNFDWLVTFYNDVGDGTKPGTVIQSYMYANASVNETWIGGTPGSLNFYDCYVRLPATLSFSAGTKYWISIQGVGAFPPQSGWAYHQTPILLHEAVFKSVYFGYPDWTNTSTVFGYAVDVCFQLTYEEEPWLGKHKMHFPQLPDLEGWDVNATWPKTLADDWRCSRTGVVEDIHFWGSWKNLDGNPYTDEYYTPMPWFLLSIHSNIPADPDTPWSRPGRLLWSWGGELPGTPSEPPAMEHWLNPNTGENFYNDHVPYWRYDFFLGEVYPPADTFVQHKDSIYWLDISALYIQPDYQWGWKSSRDHFADDATYTDEAPVGPWFPIMEPPRGNWFDVYFDTLGVPQDWGSTNFYGRGWYEYEYWWNMWFYDNPFIHQPKHVWLEFYIDPAGPGEPYAEFAINWSTDLWYYEGVPGRPPLPEDGFEEYYIGRQVFEVVPGWNYIDYWINEYNPEWVSIDFRATDVIINGWIYHECVPTSLDLAFVITGPTICGDVNGDGVIDLGDVLHLIGWLYKGGPAAVAFEAADVDCSGVIDLGDVLYLINYLYKGGPRPCDPNGDGIPDC